MFFINILTFDKSKFVLLTLYYLFLIKNLSYFRWDAVLAVLMFTFRVINLWKSCGYLENTRLFSIREWKSSNRLSAVAWLPAVTTVMTVHQYDVVNLSLTSSRESKNSSALLEIIWERWLKYICRLLSSFFRFSFLNKTIEFLFHWVNTNFIWTFVSQIGIREIPVLVLVTNSGWDLSSTLEFPF